MTTRNFSGRERLYELLADEASAALEASDAREFITLQRQEPAVARDELLQAAALAQVAFLRRTTVSRIPAELKKRLVSEGEALVTRHREAGPALRLLKTESPLAAARSPATTRWTPASSLGWALAAMFAVALVVVRNDSATVAPTPDTVATRTSLVNGSPDVITLPWAPPAAAGYEKVTGDVVWSPSRQEGYLRLANMPVNDPGRTQYQLWIVDPERDKNPVDGGVFNVSSTGEVIIPIRAKLQIRAPKAFAITAEQPGGVVVSAGPLLVVASI